MNLLTYLRRLFFPQHCIFCLRLMEENSFRLCPVCQEKLPWLREGKTRTLVRFCDECVSLLNYKGDVRDSIHRYKFGGRRWYDETYGLLLAQGVQDHLAGEYDLLSWVPVSRRRKRQRGYDQACLLAGVMGRHLDQPPVELLKKVRHTKAQSRITGAASRRANVLGVYEAVDPELVLDKRVLLVDDVVTSGSTLSECARTLKLAGADRVVCITLARAGR